MKTQPPVRQFLVEEIAAEWIQGDQRRDLIERLTAETGGSDRLAEIYHSNEEILNQYPPRVIAAQIEQRYRKRRPSRWSFRRFVIPALAAVSAAVVVVWITLPQGALRVADRAQAPAGAEEHILVKGAPQLILHRLQGSKVERVRPGQEVAPGDRLQIEYNAAEARYGVVFSVDGRGSIVLHHPFDPGDSTALASGGAHALPFSYELDDAPGFERFFLVWSDRPIQVDAVLAAAKGLGLSRTSRLVLPSGLEAVEYPLLKSPHRRHP